jgi:preprotein translocase subunit YajC
VLVFLIFEPIRESVMETRWVLGEAAAGGGMSQLLIFALIFVGMWFLLIAPNRKRQKQHQRMLDALRVGNRVLLSSGLFGKVIQIRDTRLLLELCRGVRVDALRSCVQQVVAGDAEMQEEPEPGEALREGEGEDFLKIAPAAKPRGGRRSRQVGRKTTK